MRYGDSRRVAASRVLQWLEIEDPVSIEDVHRACLFTKSPIGDTRERGGC